MGGKSPKNFKENLKNERKRFLKVEEKVCKKCMGKMKDKLQDIFFF